MDILWKTFLFHRRQVIWKEWWIKSNTLSKESVGKHICSTTLWCTTTTSFENNIYDVEWNIKFRNVRNEFQDKLKEDINEIRSSKTVFVFAANAANLYQMSDTDYNRLLGNNIVSNNRKWETKKIAESLELSKKMECYTSRLAFMTIKDQKPNFPNNTKRRLINPAKNELGLVDKKTSGKNYRECCKHHQSQLMAKHYHCHGLV